MENKQTLKYQDYIGKSRSYVISVVGNEFNDYLSDIWYYQIKTNWFGKKTYLIITFEKDFVSKIDIKKTSEKIETKFLSSSNREPLKNVSYG